MYDYKKALEAGASEDQVLEYLNSTRGYDAQGAFKAGASKSQVIEYLATTRQKPVAPIETPTEEKPQRGIIGSAINTLLVQPAARATELVGRTGILGKTIKQGYEELAGQQYDLKLPGAERAIGTVEPQKAFGQGGGAQIFSDALKSASYLAPYGKIAGAGTNLASNFVGRNASKIAGGVASGMAGGYATDVAQNIDETGEITGGAFAPGFATIIGGATGGLLEGAGVGLEKLLAKAKPLGRELEEQSLKLTGPQKVSLGAKLDEIVDYSSKNIPAGTPEQRFQYADDLYESYEENLQFFLENVAKEKRASTSVVKDTLFRQMRAIKGAYKYDRDASAIYKQIDDAILTLKDQYKGDTIPVDKLNIFKRSTFKNAYNKAGSKVMDTVEHDIGDAVRVAIERATKGGTIGGKSIGQFNREYGNLIQLRKLLKVAQGRNEIGFTKRITSRLIGGLIGYSLGGIPGIVGGELLAEPVARATVGTAVKTNLSKKLMNIGPKQIVSVIQRLRP